MKTFRLIVLIVTLLLPISMALAYETDYEVDGRFLVEATQASSGRKSLELWDVHLLRGLVRGQPSITDLDIVKISLLDSGADTYTISDINYLSYDPNTDKSSVVDGIFTFSIGFTRKHNLKFTFAPNGSFIDISGSVTTENEPNALILFKLVKDPMNITVKEPYQFQSSHHYNQRSLK